MDKKRIILIILFFAATIVIGYVLYLVFFAEEKPKPIEREIPEITIGELPFAEIAEERVGVAPPEELPEIAVQPEALPVLAPLPREELITEDRALDPTVDKSGNLNYYNSRDGKFYRLSKDGQLEPLSDQVFYNVENVTWSPTENESIIEYPDGSNIYFNFTSNKQSTLPKQWEEFSFSQEGSRIAAKNMSLAPENRWLVASNPDGTNVRLVEPVGQNADKVILDWSPNKQVVALSLTGDAVGLDRQEVLFIGQNGENFRSAIVEGRGMQSTWSPSGKKLLYSVYSARSEYKPELWITNGEPTSIGSGTRGLNINTWANKCIFAAENTIYCAVPEQLDIGAGFAPEIADDIPDQLIKIDLIAGTQKVIPLENTYNIKQILVNQEGNKLYLVDKYKAGVFSIAI